MKKNLLTFVIVAAVAVGGYVAWPTPATQTVVAEFTAAPTLYAGADVKVLGVTVGSVTKVQSEGTYVKVTMKVPASRKFPADVTAMIVPPSIIGDRYIQLGPAYDGTGAVLADGAVLSGANAQTPVELDTVYANLDQLATALGPNGANSTGALSDLLTVTAQNLNGEGTQANTTLHNLAGALGTLSDNSGNITGTVDNLAAISGTLAGDDANVRALTTNLATVATQLNSEKTDINTAVTNLTTALGDVAGFVNQNKSVLTQDVSDLTTATASVAAQKAALQNLLDALPLALTNLDHVYVAEDWDPLNPTVPVDARTGALQARGDLLTDLAGTSATLIGGICSQLPAAAQGADSALCAALSTAAGSTGGVLDTLVGTVLGGLPATAGTAMPGASTLTELLRGGVK